MQVVSASAFILPVLFIGELAPLFTLHEDLIHKWLVAFALARHGRPVRTFATEHSKCQAASLVPICYRGRPAGPSEC